MKIHKSIVTSIITIVLSSCNFATNLSEQSSIPTPDMGINVQVGKYLEVTAPSGWNSFKPDESISLEIRNTSKNQITSTLDFGMRVFLRTDKEWVEVQNKELYDYELIALEPTESYDPFKTVTTFVWPDLPDYSVTSRIRIFVFGDLIENGKASKKIGSYIDLTLNP